MQKLGLSIGQTQKLSPQQIQFIQLLQLNTLEFEKRIEEELAENPAIETEIQSEESNSELTEMDFKEATSNREEEATQSTVDSNEANKETSLDNFEDEIGNEVEELDFTDDAPLQDDFTEFLPDDDDDEYSTSGFEYDPNEEDKDIQYAVSSTLTEQLLEQFNALNISETERVLGEHLIGMIEEDGYLRRPLKNIVYDLAFLNQIMTKEPELEKVLKMIQQLDPGGVGARNLQECLLLQLNRLLASDPVVKLAKEILTNHLDELSKKHYDKLIKTLKTDRDKLKAAIDIITHLDPKPGDVETKATQPYIIPDFIVQLIDNELIVTLNNRNTPELRVSSSYMDTIKAIQEGAVNTNLKAEAQFIRQKLDNAKWFIESIKQRQNTLLLTMQTIVERQKDFFYTNDIEKLKPMILKDIAETIGMDISTVSRVVSSKYVQTDLGIYSLKEFFSEGIQTEDGSEVSNKEVKSILKEICDNELKSDPYTDEKLCELINQKGYDVARRTIAKYREQLNIPVARLRRVL